LLSTLIAAPAALAQQAQPTTEPAGGVVVSAAALGDLDEIVVNGIRRGDLILPTTVSSTSAYGLDLGVMDTPRITPCCRRRSLMRSMCRIRAGSPF
jgi:hypothetical protein